MTVTLAILTSIQIVKDFTLRTCGQEYLVDD